MSVTRLQVRHRRRSQHNCRPPPAPVTIVLCRTPKFTLDAKCVHTPAHACLVSTTERLASHLFCNFARWATVVHRGTPPTTLVQAARCLAHLRWPAKPIGLTCDTTQVNVFAFGKHLRLNTASLLPHELRDLQWLALATTAWQSSAAKHKSGSSTRAETTTATLQRKDFVLNNIFERAHAAMLVRDKYAWGGLVPEKLNDMLLHACGRLKPKRGITSNSPPSFSAGTASKADCRCL